MWWIQNKLHYPQLHIMALDLLGIPAVSAEIERVFSSSGLLIRDRRNCLKEDIIEAVEYLKSWTRDVSEPRATSSGRLLVHLY